MFTMVQFISHEAIFRLVKQVVTIYRFQQFVTIYRQVDENRKWHIVKLDWFILRTVLDNE